MFFKNKVNVADYCSGKLTRLFSQEREATWNDLRIRCNDAQLNQADNDAYYSNLRAAMITLMSIAIAKNCSVDSMVHAGGFVADYLDKRGLTQIDSLCSEYSRAFGGSSTDGVQQMVLLFAEKLTQSNMGEPTKQQFYAEFYAMLRALFEEFKSVKLVTT
ncbi:MAG: hypothetical protein ABSD63_13530 [Candidatus Korobacteraceae bacterium]|jgi:hypothetical protein